MLVNDFSIVAESFLLDFIDIVSYSSYGSFIIYQRFIWQFGKRYDYLIQFINTKLLSLSFIKIL